MSRRLLVLGWHNIDPTWAFHGESPEAARHGFERQVRTLRRWAHVVPLRRALADLAMGRALPSRAVALTFDDGYLDSAGIVAPVLHAAGLPATFFLVPGFLSGQVTAWWEDLGWALAHATVPGIFWDGAHWDTSTPAARQVVLASLSESLKSLDRHSRQASVASITELLEPVAPGTGPRRLFMDWDDARSLTTLGHDVGSHTWSHPILSSEVTDAQGQEMARSRQALQDWFQRPIDMLALPNGRRVDYSDTTLELAAATGHSYVLTTLFGIVDKEYRPYEIRRVIVDARTNLGNLLIEWARVTKHSLWPGRPAADPRLAAM